MCRVHEWFFTVSIVALNKAHLRPITSNIYSAIHFKTSLYSLYNALLCLSYFQYIL